MPPPLILHRHPPHHAPRMLLLLLLLLPVLRLRPLPLPLPPHPRLTLPRLKRLPLPPLPLPPLRWIPRSLQPLPLPPPLPPRLLPLTRPLPITAPPSMLQRAPLSMHLTRRPTLPRAPPPPIRPPPLLLTLWSRARRNGVCLRLTITRVCVCAVGAHPLSQARSSLCLASCALFSSPISRFSSISRCSSPILIHTISTITITTIDARQAK